MFKKYLGYIQQDSKQYVTHYKLLEIVRKFKDAVQSGAERSVQKHAFAFILTVTVQWTICMIFFFNCHFFITMNREQGSNSTPTEQNFFKGFQRPHAPTTQILRLGLYFYIYVTGNILLSKVIYFCNSLIQFEINV